MGPDLRVEVRLGDGRARPARTLPLPGGYAEPGARAWVFEVPADAAIRAVRVRAANGRLVHDIGLRQAPPQLMCSSSLGFGIGLYTTDDTGSSPTPPFTSPPVVLQPAGGPPLSVRDADAELCLAVGQPGAKPLCQLPLPYLILPVVVSSRDGRVVGGAVDPRVTAVATTMSDGSRRRVATDPGSGYVGRFAGLVRFFSVVAPPGERIDSITLLDSRGRRLINWPVSFELVPVGRQRRVVTGHARGGRFDLVEAHFPIPFLNESLDCLSVVRHGRRAQDLGDCLGLSERGHISTRSANGVVRCDLRAAIIVGGAPRAASAVRLRLDDGSSRPGRLFESRLGRAFLAVPPANRGLQRVEIVDRAGRSLRSFRAPVPPATRQCGYDFELVEDSAWNAHPATVSPLAASSQLGTLRGSRLVSPGVRAAAPPRVWQPYAGHRWVRLTPVPWRGR